MLTPVKLDYDFSIFLTAEYESSEGSCIKHLTHELADVNWVQGNGWLWDSDVLHLGANAGMQNKFTLQVSGFLNK
jgi:hypothetical protein